MRTSSKSALRSASACTPPSSSTLDTRAQPCRSVALLFVCSFVFLFICLSLPLYPCFVVRGLFVVCLPACLFDTSSTSVNLFVCLSVLFIHVSLFKCFSLLDFQLACFTLCVPLCVLLSMYFFIRSTGRFICLFPCPFVPPCACPLCLLDLFVVCLLTIPSFVSRSVCSADRLFVCPSLASFFLPTCDVRSWCFISVSPAFPAVDCTCHVTVIRERAH